MDGRDLRHAGRMVPGRLVLSPRLSLPAGLVLANAFDASDTSQATYRLCNVTNAAINADTLILHFIVIRVP